MLHLILIRRINGQGMRVPTERHRAGPSREGRAWHWCWGVPLGCPGPPPPAGTPKGEVGTVGGEESPGCLQAPGPPRTEGAADSLPAPPTAPGPPRSPLPPGLAAPACLSAHQAGSLTRPDIGRTVPLIKVLIELNGCGNEQMSSIKSKESDRPINRHAEHNYNIGNTRGRPPTVLIVTGGFMVIGPTTGSSQTCPGLVIKKMIFYTNAGWAN